MSDFRMMHTPQGEQLLAQVHAGVTMELTRVVLGNGIWTDEEQASHDMTGLKAQRMSLAITAVAQAGDEAEVTAMLDNSALAEGFSCTEMGVYARPVGGEEILYMVGYLEPSKSSFVHSRSGTPMLIPVTVTIVVAGSSEVVITFKSDFYYVTKAELARHDADPDVHGPLVDTLRTHAPLVVVVGSADILEGEAVQLLVQDWHTYAWPSEVKLRITDASGADITDAWEVNPDLTTGLVTLKAPEVDADQTYSVAIQIWEHGLVRSMWIDVATVNVGDVPINQPAIVAPAEGDANVGETPTISTSAFSADADQTHADTQMQIATDSGFSDVVRDTGSLGAVTVYDVPPGILVTGQVYYTRARHKGSDGNWSPWSLTRGFFTASSFIYVDRPVNVSPSSGTGDIGETPTLVASAYSTNGDGELASAQFQIDLQGGDFSAPVHDSGPLGAVTEYTVPAGVLQPGTAYIWRVRYTDDTAEPVVSDWSGPTVFTIADQFGVPWVPWDQTTESGLAHPRCFVAMMENISAGGNELGQGGELDTAARLVTQTGNVAGALGTPPYRALTAGNTQSLNLTDEALSLLKSPQFTLVLKWNGGSNTGLLRLDMGPSYYPGVGMGSIGFTRMIGTGAEPFMLYGPAATVYRSPTDAQYFNSGGPFWHVLWSDGEIVRCGLCKGPNKPCKLSDFDYAWDVTTSDGSTSNYTRGGVTPNAFNETQLGGDIRSINHYSYGADPGGGAGAQYHYIVIAGECLIDNSK